MASQVPAGDRMAAGKRALASAVQGLTRDQQRSLDMALEHGQTYRQIARAQERPPEAVRDDLRTALLQVRAVFDERGIDPRDLLRGGTGR